MHAAAYDGEVNIVAILLRMKEFEVNQTVSSIPFIHHHDDVTPLQIAADRGHENIVQLLLVQNDIQVNKATKSGATPLFIAARKGHEKVVKILW